MSFHFPEDPDDAALACGLNLSATFYNSFIASQLDGDREHAIENVQTTLAILREDLEDGDTGVTMAFMMGLAHLAQLSLVALGDETELSPVTLAAEITRAQAAGRKPQIPPEAQPEPPPSAPPRLQSADG